VKGRFPRLFKLAMALALVVGLVPVIAAPASALGPADGMGFVVTPNTAGSAVQVSITPVLGVALASPADTVTITLSSFTVPATISKSYVSFGGQSLTTDPIVVGSAITLIVPDSDGNPANGFTAWPAAATTIQISQLAGIKNPSVGVYRYRASVVTSQETTSVNSNYIVIVRTLSRSPSSGVRGTATTVTGAGFASGTTANVVRGLAGGADAASATVLTETGGTNFTAAATLVAVGNIVRNISDGSFMVVTAVAATTLTGAALIGGNANTWVIGDLYAVELTGPALGSGLVGSDGAFTAVVTISVPPFAAGSNTLVATDGVGRSATTTFTVSNSITLSPTSALPGATVTVTGRDWTSTTIAANSTTLAGAALTHAAPTIASGAFSFTFVVPTVLAGAKTLVVTGATPSQTASATLTVLGSPLVASPSGGVIGTRVTVSGTGFSANGSIPANTITFSGTPFTHPTVTIDSGGNFLVALTLSSAALDAVAANPGTYTINIADLGPDGLAATGDERSGVANFTVPAISLTLSTASSVVGSSVVVRGAGFPANTVAIITYAGSPVGTGIVDSTGNFAAAISVPTTAAIPSTNIIGAYAITANAVTVPPAATPAQATHSVPTASLTLSATSGNPGSTLRITGAGFPAYAVVSALTLGGLPAMPSPAPATDGLGNVTANVIVPALPAGPAVVALTVATVTGSQPFTITTAAITPAVALAGIAGKYTRVWGYNAATKTHLLYDPAVPAISDLTVLARGQGYWINATEAVTLVYGANQYVLVAGWNLIGWLD